MCKFQYVLNKENYNHGDRVTIAHFRVATCLKVSPGAQAFKWQ